MSSADSSPFRSTRRTFLMGAPLALAGCAVAPPLAQTPVSSAFYGQVTGERFPVDAVDLTLIDPRFLRQDVAYAGREAPGTIVVDPGEHFLYHVRSGGMATRYGVGVGRRGFGWSGTARIARKAEWPDWYPPVDMQRRDKQAAKYAGGMPGGSHNPLGARAMYLYQGDEDTLYRLHGTIEPASIGQSMSSGCIRLLNQDVIDLFNHTPVGTRVVVLKATQPA